MVILNVPTNLPPKNAIYVQQKISQAHGVSGQQKCSTDQRTNPSEPPALMPAMSAAQPARAVVSPTMFTQLFEALKRGGWMDTMSRGQTKSGGKMGRF